MIYKNIRHALCAVLLVAFSPTVFASSAQIAIMIEAVMASLFPTGMTYTLYIHGKDSTDNGQGDYTRFDYWGDASRATGPRPKAVNWQATIGIADTNNSIRRALDCYCTGRNWCHIGAHSAGNLQIGYAIANYSSTMREIKSAVTIPDGGGECYKASGSQGGQVGWNIKSVHIAAGAAGGSEMAPASTATQSVLDGIRLIGEQLSSEEIFAASIWLRDLVSGTSTALDEDLTPWAARGLYNHNDTSGLTFNMYAGSKTWTWLDPFLFGNDDHAVGYHSSGGMSQHGRYCNEYSDYNPFLPCYKLEFSDRGSNGVRKWTGHNLVAKDVNHEYGHGPSGNWGGPIEIMLPFIALSDAVTRSGAAKSVNLPRLSKKSN